MPRTRRNFGILAAAAYVPRWRLARETISAATGWARGLGAGGPGQRSFANWDEDAVTMAVEAARAALGSRCDPVTDVRLDSLQLASTTLPFADRSNSGIVREALGAGDELSPGDLAGSRRAAVTGLLGLLSRQGGLHLLCASDCIDAQPASEAELALGHGAAAVLVGEGQPLAILKGSASLHEDFVDQYRMSDQRFDYRLESRWIRDAGTLGQLQGLAARALNEAGLAARDLDWFLLPAEPALARAARKQCGAESAGHADDLFERVGLCGAAHPLLMLCHALEQARPGEHILLFGAGQGFDALVFEVTGKPDAHTTLAERIDGGRLEDNYTRYLSLRRILAMDAGIRSERDNRTALSVHYRRHADITGFTGGRCSACGKLQFPRTRYCVHCQARETQSPERLSGLAGEVNSYTEDWLAFTPRPPLMFGNVHFPGGANVLMEFSDYLAGELSAGEKVGMSFRIKDIDTRRNFRRYFWKPTPLRASPGSQGDG